MRQVEFSFGKDKSLNFLWVQVNKIERRIQHGSKYKIIISI